MVEWLTRRTFTAKILSSILSSPIFFERNNGMSELIFYATVAANMPHGAGHWEIQAKDEAEARKLAFEKIPEGRWCFIYTSLDEMHQLDRTCHGRIQ